MLHIILELSIQLQDYLEVCGESTEKVVKVAGRSRFGQAVLAGMHATSTKHPGRGEMDLPGAVNGVSPERYVTARRV